MTTQVSAALARFRSAALRYCEFVDSLATHSVETFLGGAETPLLELYASALELPAVAPDSAEVDNLPRPIEKEVALFKSLREKLGSSEIYYTIFNSINPEKPMQGSLANDFSEIYFDLKHDLELTASDAPSNDVLWTLRFSFRSHWGRHAISALKALHDLRSLNIDC